MKHNRTTRFESAYNRHTRIGCCNTLLPLFHQGKTLPCPIEPFFLLQCSLIFFVQVSVQRNLTYLSARMGADKFLCVLTFYPSLKDYVVKEARTDNSTYPKAGVKWLNQALCFYLSSLFIDSFRFQNPRLRVAASRYQTCKKKKKRPTWTQVRNTENILFVNNSNEQNT